MIDHAIKEKSSRIAAVEFNVHQLKSFGNGKVGFPTTNGTLFIKVQQISFFKANDAYSELHDINGNKFFISKSLKWIEEKLTNIYFYRVHKSYFINLYNVSLFHKNDSAVIMESGAQIPVSRRKRLAISKMMAW